MTDPQHEFTLDENSILPTGVRQDDGSYSDTVLTDSDGIIPASRANPPRLRLGGSGDVKDFAHGVYQLVSILKPAYVFTHAYPESIINHGDEQPDRTNRVPTFAPTITWKVFRREPGSLGEKPFGPRTMKKPRIMERAVQSETNPDFLVAIYEMDYDNILQFDIFSETNEECEDMAVWFEDTMIMFLSYFQELGFKKVFFYRRFVDEHVDRMATGLNSRSLHYYVRTNRYFQTESAKLKEIYVKLLKTVTTEDKYIDFRTGKLQDDLFSN